MGLKPIIVLLGFIFARILMGSIPSLEMFICREVNFSCLEEKEEAEIFIRFKNPLQSFLNPSYPSLHYLWKKRYISFLYESNRITAII